MDLQQAELLFRGQYLGQQIYRYDNHIEHVYELVGGHCYHDYQKGFLLLKSVSDLTDEQRLQVGIVAFPMFVPLPEKDYDTLRKLALTVLDRGHLSSRTHQTLIRYGVLVPFTYIDISGTPITLQPEEIIEKGWAKLQTK